MNKPEVEALFAALDVNKDGCISYNEFLASTMEKNLYLNEERLWNAFQVFDRDSNGKISADELNKVLNSQQIDVDSEVFLKMVAQFDVNGD